MNNFNDNLLILVVLIAFVIGYLLLSFIVKKLKAHFEAAKNDNKARGSNSNYQKDSNYHSSNGKQEKKYSQKSNSYGPDLERYYLEILDLKLGSSIEEIKKNYRYLVTKYHPDKVNHLGVEFHKIAADKTRDINEAYAYLKRKYNIV